MKENKNTKIRRILATVKGFKYVTSIPISLWIQNPQEAANMLKEMSNQFKK